MNKSGFILFLTIVLTIWAVLHAYVFWRAASVPWIAAHLKSRYLWFAALLLWALYPLARTLNSRDLQMIGVPLEFIAATWMGVLFLLFSALLVVDVVTLGGLVLPRVAPMLRGCAVLVAAALSVLALVQGLRRPLVRDHEVRMAGLPRELEGLTVVAVSDIHLGTLIGERWLAQTVDRVNDLSPDLVLVVGDLIDGDARHAERVLPVLKRLQPARGLWAVTGNHEFYAGADRCVALMEAAGCRVLRDTWAEAAPGLIIAGVDDLTARRQFGLKDNAIERTLTNVPPGAVLLLSHTPWQAERAASLGAGLMVSGHTHDGQIWPFNYIVQTRYPLVSGRYEFGRMTLLVGRGTATWGPRMRLWSPGEILRITLRGAETGNR